MEKFSHKILGDVLIEPTLKQRQVEMFFELMNEYTLKDEKHSGAYSDRVIVENAIKAKIVLQEIDIAESTPAFINWLATQVVEYVNKSREIPKN